MHIWFTHLWTWMLSFHLSSHSFNRLIYGYSFHIRNSSSYPTSSTPSTIPWELVWECSLKSRCLFFFVDYRWHLERMKMHKRMSLAILTIWRSWSCTFIINLQRSPFSWGEVLDIDLVGTCIIDGRRKSHCFRILIGFFYFGIFIRLIFLVSIFIFFLLIIGRSSCITLMVYGWFLHFISPVEGLFSSLHYSSSLRMLFYFPSFSFLFLMLFYTSVSRF